MLNLTPEAQAKLEKYLHRAGLSLREAEDEVIRELREHIERALESKSQPVSGRDMDAVLQEMGDASHFIMARRDTPRHAKGNGRRNGRPADWWLAWTSFALLILGSILVAPPVGIAASFLASRAVLATHEGERDLGWMKWLVYPSLVLVYVPLAAITFWWPLAPIIARAASDPYGSPFQLSGLSLLLLLLALLMWWFVLAALVRPFPRFMPSIFRPFVKPGLRFAMGMALSCLLLSYLLTCPLFARLGPLTVVTSAGTCQSVRVTR